MSCSELVTRDKYTQKLPTRAFLLYTYLAWTGEKRLVEIGRQKLALARLCPDGGFFIDFLCKSTKIYAKLTKPSPKETPTTCKREKGKSRELRRTEPEE